MDSITKLLLAAIALGLWANVAVHTVGPAMADDDYHVRKVQNIIELSPRWVAFGEYQQANDLPSARAAATTPCFMNSETLLKGEWEAVGEVA